MKELYCWCPLEGYCWRPRQVAGTYNLTWRKLRQQYRLPTAEHLGPALARAVQALRSFTHHMWGSARLAPPPHHSAPPPPPLSNVSRSLCSWHSPRPCRATMLSSFGAPCTAQSGLLHGATRAMVQASGRCLQPNALAPSRRTRNCPLLPPRLAALLAFRQSACARQLPT